MPGGPCSRFAPLTRGCSFLSHDAARLLSFLFVLSFSVFFRMVLSVQSPQLDALPTVGVKVWRLRVVMVRVRDMFIEWRVNAGFRVPSRLMPSFVAVHVTDFTPKSRGLK
jgi:hypothetical protein